MSVSTRADENLDAVRKHIEEATKLLSEIVVDQCWGHDEFSPEYKKKIKDLFLYFLELKDEF